MKRFSRLEKLTACEPPFAGNWVRRAAGIVGSKRTVQKEFVLNRLNPDSFSKVRSMLANFTCSAICFGSGSGAREHVHNRLSRASAPARRPLDLRGLTAVRSVTIVSPFPVTSTLAPVSSSIIDLRKCRNPSWSGVTVDVRSEPVRRSPRRLQWSARLFAFTITSRGRNHEPRPAIFGSGGSHLVSRPGRTREFAPPP